MPKRKKRRRSPGVSLLKPQSGSRQGWRVAFNDPDDDTRKRRTIPFADARTAELRESYCVRLSEQLANRRRELDGGATPKAHRLISEAREEWVATYPSKRTRKTYGDAVEHFEQWANDHRVGSLDDVRKSTLRRFRDDHYTADVAHTTLNQRLRSLGTFLRWCIYSEYCPQLVESDIAALKKWREQPEKRPHLDPPDVKRAFEAVQRYDHHAAAGHRRGPAPAQLMPLFMLTTLGGLRLGEAVALDWSHFKRDALDASGREVGAIEITAAISKIKKPRTIPLDHSPALRRYLIRRGVASGWQGTLAGISYASAKKGLRKLHKEYRAPTHFSWQAMRVTASSFLTSAPNIFGAGAHAQSADRLGHSWKVAQQHYAAAIAGIAGDATTLEAALRIEDQVKRACAASSETDSAPSTSLGRTSA
jgi:integrase